MFPKNKRIGIDLDETIVSSFEPMVTHINQKYNSSLKFEHLIHHDWWTISEFPIDKNMIVKEWEILLISNPSETNFLPISGSKELLSFLKKIGYELHIITARNEKSRKKSTNTWIEQNFSGVFSGVHFTSHYCDDNRKDKSEICQMLDIKLMIDDNLDFALELAHKGITCFLLEKPWNKQRTEIHPLIIRVKDWKEIEQKFLEFHS